MGDSATPQGGNIPADLQKSYGTNWTKTNVTTLQEWITIASYNIQILIYAAQYHQKIIRDNIILGLILSTASGTISSARFGLTSTPTIDYTLNGLFTAMSFIIAIFTGCLKVYSIQERLEEFIRLRQEWTEFSTAIASELQLPIPLRRDALFVIMKRKSKYLDLLKSSPDVPAFCVERVRLEFIKYANGDLDSTNLSKTMMGIAAQEMVAMDQIEDAAKQAQVLKRQQTSVTSPPTIDASTIQNNTQTNNVQNSVQTTVIPTTLTIPVQSPIAPNTLQQI